MVALPNPEIRPAVDESPPEIGPNLATNVELAKAVTKHIVTEYFWPYEQMQMRFWPVWDKIDKAWRARFAVSSLNPSNVSAKTLKEGRPSAEDGQSAKAQSVMPFKQMHAVSNIGEQLSWDDGVPFRCEVPEDVDEDDFYRPTAESAKAAQTILRQNAEDIELRTEYRKNFGGGFAKYGHAWALCDFEKRIEDVNVAFPVDMQDPQLVGMQMQMVMQKYPGAQPTVQMTERGPAIVVGTRQVEKFITNFRHLKCEDVFIDPFLPCDQIDRQPCPIVREHVTENDIEANAYHPENNPFGYVNIREAVRESAGHYVLTQEDETPLRQKLQGRYNLTDQVGGGDRRQRMKQRWTCFPMLRIGPDGALDSGNGVKCPHCDGSGMMADMVDDAGNPAESKCKTCEGSGNVHPPAERYIAVMFGGIRSATTCIRLQKMPDGMTVPLIFSADLVEDDSCALPMAKSEIAIIPVEQATMAEVQFQDAKENVIYRGWKVKDDSPAWNIQDFNKPNAKIPYESNPDEAIRVESNNFDETVTLEPYIARKEAQIQAIYGATDTLLGMISGGRRSALEIGEATDAAKNPLVLMVDRYNASMIGKWARMALRNLELFGDRDYIRRKTGREFFGKVRIYTAVGQEFIKKIASEQNLRWLLQAAPTIPALQPVMPQICNKLLRMMGINDIRVPDGGIGKGVSEAMHIVSMILGNGVMIPPSPDDPHEVFMGVFIGAMKDAYWQANAPQNLPLLAQRMEMQQQLLIQQQMMQMQAQIAQNNAINGDPNAPRGNQPKKPEHQAEGAGERNQMNQG